MTPAYCRDCTRPLRPCGTTVAAYPGTVQHDGHGRCTTCAARHRRGLPPLTEPPAGMSPLCPCAECGRMTRPPRWPADRAPGTIRRVSRGLCSTCYQHHAEEHDRINADHTAEPEPEPPAPAPLTLAQLDQAVCARRPAHWWDTDHATDGTTRAVALCGGCPIQDACLATAMAEEGASIAAARWGVRGGLTPTERYQAYRDQANAKRRAATAARRKERVA